MVGQSDTYFHAQMQYTVYFPNVNPLIELILFLNISLRPTKYSKLLRTNAVKNALQNNFLRIFRIVILL